MSEEDCSLHRLCRVRNKGVVDLEQAKKHDRKIMITDIAIEKVPYVEVSGLSQEQCETIQQEHREILRIAQSENESNEVLTIMSKNLLARVRVKGSEFEVLPASDPRAVSLLNRSGRQELMYLHNHPSTKIFSLADIMTFIQYGEICLMSVVTNQGTVHILYKNQSYNYTVTCQLLDVIYRRYQVNELTHDVAVKEFLKMCSKGGITYAQSGYTAGHKR